jgi:hypothetical protein
MRTINEGTVGIVRAANDGGSETPVSKSTEAILASEDFASKMANARSLIKRGNEAVAKNDYAVVKKCTDDAYDIVDVVDTTALSLSEQAVLKELRDLQSGLAWDLSLMDEPTE